MAVLAREASATPDRRRDLLWLRGVKYTLVTAVEACVDVAQHLCATQGWGPPSGNGHARALLGEHGVLERDHAATLRRAVGLRNVLVHDYATVNDDLVLARLADVDELHRFVGRVTARLDRA